MKSVEDGSYQDTTAVGIMIKHWPMVETFFEHCCKLDHVVQLAVPLSSTLSVVERRTYISHHPSHIVLDLRQVCRDSCPGC